MIPSNETEGLCFNGYFNLCMHFCKNTYEHDTPRYFLLLWMDFRRLYVTYSFLAHSASAHVTEIHCGNWALSEG